MNKQLSGRKFGSITVIEHLRGKLWHCRCACGNDMEAVLEGALTSGLIISCGCQGTYGMSAWGKEQYGNRRIKNLTGQKFGQWTVLSCSGKANFSPTSQTVWKCRCDCGVIKDRVLYGSLTKGSSTSCGCSRKEELSKRFTTHGLSISHKAMYTIWAGMKTRCFNKSHPSYARYGGRGITVCNQWIMDFPMFLKDVGPRPSKLHSLDRIDNDGDYEPGNVRWATRTVQANNKSNSKLILFNGKPMSLTNICRDQNVSLCSVYQELKKGGTVEDAVAEIRSRSLVFKERSQSKKK